MKERNIKIDALRLVFCIMIVFYHSNKFIGNSVYFSKGWYISVDFFFLVSGIYLMTTLDKYMQDNNGNINVIEILWKKIKNVWFLYLCSYFCAFITIQVTDLNGWKRSAQILVDSIGRIFLLEMAGDILGGYSLPGGWYLSSLMVGSLIVLCIYVISRKFFFEIVAPLFVILFLGYFNQTYGQIHRTHDWTVFIYSGTIRAAAEILLGCICYKIGLYIKSNTMKKFWKNIFLILEFCCYLAVIIVSFYVRASSIDFLYLILLAIAVTLSYGIEVKGNKILTGIAWLGKNLSLPVYLNHLWIIYLLKDISIKMSLKILVYIFCLIGSCTVVLIIKHIFINLFSKYSVYRKKAISTY